MIQSIHPTARAHSAHRAGNAARPATGQADPIDRVDQLIADLQSGKIKYAPEVAANIRPNALTLSNYPCQRYILKAGKKPVDARALATEIVPRGEKSMYKHAVVEDSKLSKKETARDLEARVERIGTLANELKRQGTESLMVWVEGDNADGKDGLINHVFSLSPLANGGVKSFKAAKGEETEHEANWRIMRNLAGPGQIAFHNRSAYGDVVFAAQTPAAKAQRIADIKEMEYGLSMGLPMTPEGHIALPDAQGKLDPSAIQRPPMRIIKVILNVSKPEQAARLADRLINDTKTDKMSPADLSGHPRHDEIQSDFANAMAATSTPWAPSYYLPNDNKKTGWRKMAQIADEILQDMNPQRRPSPVSRAEREALAQPLLDEAKRARRK